MGIQLGTLTPPQDVSRLAQLADTLGYNELWISEDSWFTGGISSATAALAATTRIPVGLGIVSAMTRHPALLAQEISTVAHMFPGQLWPGIGLGMPLWLRQMGIYPRSQLDAVRQCVP